MIFLSKLKEININMRFDAKYPAYAYEPVGLILSKPPVSKKLNKKTIGNDKIEDPGGWFGAFVELLKMSFWMG